MTTPYTYRIKWSKTGMNYYGVRYAVGCAPSDLFVEYFTSSKYVAEYINEHGLPDIVEVRRTFSEDQKDTAREYEHRVLRRLKITKRADYLNKGLGKALPPLSGEDNAMSRPEVRERQQAGAKLAANRPEVKAKKSASIKIAVNVPEVKAKHIAKMKTINKDPKKISKANATLATSLLTMPEMKQKRKASAAASWKDKSKRENRSGKNASTYDHEIRTFINIDGTVVKCTRHELELKYDLRNDCLSKLLSGVIKSHRGWKIYESK